MKPRTGSASKCYTFSHTAAGSSSNLATLDRGAIVATVDGEHEPLAMTLLTGVQAAFTPIACAAGGDGGTAWCGGQVLNGRHFANFFVIRGVANVGVVRPLWRLAVSAPTRSLLALVRA